MKQYLIAFLLLACSCALADLKSTNRMTIAGNSFSSTVLMKQGKVRNEMTLAPGVSTVSIQDCAGHRLIQINDRARTYLITEIGSGSGQIASLAGAGSGTVTLSVNEQDTGESKQLFGYAARHLKGTITSEGEGGSCGGNFRVTTDGWYVDLPAMQGCAPPEREMLHSRLQRDGCNDRVVLNRSGVEKVGYPVLLDTNIKDNGRDTAIHQETTDLSPAALDPALFEVPAGYKQVQSYQELMDIGRAESPVARPSEGSTGNTNGFGLGAAPAKSPEEKTSTTEKKKGVLRVGVAQVTSSADQSLATDGWQQQLVNDINFLGGQAIVLSIDPHDREAALDEAKQKDCDYVVFTNVITFKTASVGEKLGRVFGGSGLGGVGGTGHGRVEINAEVKVFQPDNPVPILDGNNDFRQNDADATAKGLLQTEARYVMLEIKKLEAAK